MPRTNPGGRGFPRPPGLADAIALMLGLIGLMIFLTTQSVIGAIVAWAGLWLEFNRLVEVRWIGWNRSEADENDLWLP